MGDTKNRGLAAPSQPEMYVSLQQFARGFAIETFAMALLTVFGLLALVLAVGGALGLAAAIALGRALNSMLFQVGGGDPLTLAGVGMVLGTVGLLAGYLPARRASGIDPIVTLRAE